MLANDNKQRQFYEIVKSRSDGTLLTVSFNLRIWNRITKHQHRHCEVRSNPDFNYSEFAIIKTQSCCVLRRLKSAVNKVSSLRDWLGRVA